MTGRTPPTSLPGSPPGPADMVGHNDPHALGSPPLDEGMLARLAGEMLAEQLGLPTDLPRAVNTPESHAFGTIPDLGLPRELPGGIPAGTSDMQGYYFLNEAVSSTGLPVTSAPSSAPAAASVLTLPSTRPPATPSTPSMPSTPSTPSTPSMPSMPGTSGVMGLVPAAALPSAASVPTGVAVPTGMAVPSHPSATAGIPTSVPSSVPTSVPGLGHAGHAGQSIPFAGISTPFVLDLRPEAIPHVGTGPGHFDVHAVRRDFPILQERVHGKQLIWLDNAATTHKPRAVMERITRFYERENSNIHRAAHTLAGRATDAYEAAREKTRAFLNAPSVKDIVFVRGCTEAINLVAKAWGWQNVGRDDEILLTTLEHHSNIVPWQMLAAATGARIKVAPIDNDGQVILHEYERLLSPRTRIVSFTHVSNALGTVNPAAEMVAMAHRHGATVLVDGAQSVSHMPVDVQALGADFFVFSGHKVFGPTGIGVLYGRADVLEGMQPWQGGGNMIVDVTFDRTTYAGVPARFEAGTGNIADAVGLGAALDYVMSIGMETISRYEHELLVYGTELLRSIPGLRLIGTAREKAGVMSFVLDGHRTEDVGAALDKEGIAVRSGHHCAQPALRHFGLEGSVRPSLALYNTHAELDALADAVRRIARRGP